MRSRLEPIKAVARMIDRRLDTIITHCRHQLTNAVAEGLTSKIMAIKRRAGGYRNVANFKEVIYFYCGGLRLYPSSVRLTHGLLVRTPCPAGAYAQ